MQSNGVSNSSLFMINLQTWWIDMKDLVSSQLFLSIIAIIMFERLLSSYNVISNNLALLQVIFLITILVVELSLAIGNRLSVAKFAISGILIAILVVVFMTLLQLIFNGEFINYMKPNDVSLVATSIVGLISIALVGLTAYSLYLYLQITKTKAVTASLVHFILLSGILYGIYWLKFGG